MQSLEKSLTLLQLRFALPAVGRQDLPLCFGYQQLKGARSPGQHQTAAAHTLSWDLAAPGESERRESSFLLSHISSGGTL